NSAVESAIARASAEVWATILEFAIELPESFTDPDTVADNYYRQKWPPSHSNEESEYWAIEQTKTELRTVCSSWNSLLQGERYSHRFVSMLDVHYGYVPADALKRAERVSFRPAARGTPREGIASSEGWVSRCMEIIEAVGPIPMRIATEIPSVALQDFCDTLSSHAPSLVTVTVPRGTSSAFIFPATFESLPNLRHLHSAPSVLQLNAPPGATVEVANLVALTIGCGHESLRVNHQRWSFPVLETLRLWSMDHPEEEARMEGLVTTLRALGKNVRTLELPTSEMEDMPAEVWSLCPKVERLFTSHQVRSIPPPNHPIHTIGIPFVREHHIGYDEWTTYPHIPEFPGLRTVVINNPRAWDMIDEANYLFGYIRDCHSRGVRLEDANGFTYEERH
ncbi:hypothetical protein FS842_006837, partial [Serendipita sp. 407]